jgi:hypothetical protein
MNVIDELSRLADLHRDGTLTDDEFARAKALLLGRPANFAEPAEGSVTPDRTSAPPNTSPAPPPKTAPSWMRPWGWLLTWIGVVAFAATTYVNWNADHARVGLIAGVLNPVFFIGVPVGLYWLKRSGELDRLLEPDHVARLHPDQKASEWSKFGSAIMLMIGGLAVIMCLGHIIDHW